MSSQLILENIAVRLPNRDLFADVNWTLYEGDRIALAGRNGCGKSTLMRILAGRGEPTEGRRTAVGGKNLRIGYLDQSLLDKAVLDCEEKGITDSPVKFLTDQLPPEEDREWEVRKMLGGLGFTSQTMSDPVANLSGGWLLRMFLASTLLENPEVLLLDEPTNHLDISSIQWLEEFLQNEYQGSLILITHDISLQRKTTDALAVIHGGHFYARKQFNDYLTFRESLVEDEKILRKKIENIDKKTKELQAFVDKYRAKARSASRAQSKLRNIETLNEERQELVDQVARVASFVYGLNFQFRMNHPGGKFPIVADNLSFRYSDDGPWITRNFSMDVARGQTIAIIGDNGAGKTTLLNLLAQKLDPQTGHLEYGHNVDVGYFGQHQLDELSLEDTVFENLRIITDGVSIERLRAWLGAFGFSTEEDIQKKAKVLSGGERARLALLRILVTPVNVIMLDEPTNHLDIETKDLLKRSIRDYEGTICMVSHDRDFLSAVADRILYVSRDHKITDHIGNLDSFFEKYPELVRHIDGKISTPVKTEEPEKPKGPTLSYEERKKVKNQIRNLGKKVAGIEAEIDSIGKEKAKIEEAMGKDTFYQDYSEAEREVMLKTAGEADQKILSLMVQWEKLSSEHTELKEKHPDIQ